MSVKERLTQYLEIKGISKSEFGRTIGVSNAYITSMRKSIDPEKLQSIALHYQDLNINWLMTGEGNTTTSIYINFDMKKVDEANRRVIDYVLYDKR